MKEKITFAMLMGIVTTAIVSFTLVSVLKGFGVGFIQAWIKSWLIAYVTAIPVIILVSPKVQALVGYLFRKNVAQSQTQN